MDKFRRRSGAEKNGGPNIRNRAAGQLKAAKGPKTSDSPRLEMRDIIKDINLLNESHMTWKERKEEESRRIVSLGGKAVKKQRLPLSVARVQMKKQKERKEKLMANRTVLENYGIRVDDDPGNNARKLSDKRNPGSSVWRSEDCMFRNGALIVKNKLGSAPPRENVGSGSHVVDDRRNMKGTKRSQQNKRGKSKKRR